MVIKAIFTIILVTLGTTSKFQRNSLSLHSKDRCLDLFYVFTPNIEWIAIKQSGILLGWVTNLCTQPSEVWHLCKWHLLICIFLRHLKWVKTTNFQILRNATCLSATNQHSSKWYPRLLNWPNHAWRKCFRSTLTLTFLYRDMTIYLCYVCFKVVPEGCSKVSG